MVNALQLAGSDFFVDSVHEVGIVEVVCGEGEPVFF